MQLKELIRAILPTSQLYFFGIKLKFSSQFYRNLQTAFAILINNVFNIYYKVKIKKKGN